MRASRRLTRRATATGLFAGLPPAALDQLHAVAVRVLDEAEARATLAHGVRRALGLDSLLREARQRRIDVVDRESDVPVAGAELVRVDADVVGELEPVAVAGQPHEDVHGLG